MSRIRPLSADAVAQLHSSKHITTLSGVVLALLENSLDAGATKVDVTVDFRRGACIVDDDGSGILSCEFEEKGGLGKLHHSSKSNDNRDLHGRTGTYLASLSALSLLRIVSQHSDDPMSGTITLHTGKIIERRVEHAASLKSSLTGRHGTQVTVRDLFGNMPVRVKQRALSCDADPKDEKAWHDLKRGTVALLLAWPNPCAVRIRDSNNVSKAVSLAAHHPSVSGLLTEKHLNQLAGRATRFDMKDALPVVFQAGLAAVETRSEWVAVRASSGSLAVKGLICLKPAPSRQCQFVSIGVHPCSPASGHNALFDIVNKTFANSSFGAIEDETQVLDEAEVSRRGRDRRYKNDGYTTKQLRNQKGVDHWPMFILQLSVKEPLRNHALADNMGDAKLQNIVDLLEATMLQWLTANHFRPRNHGRRRNHEQQGPVSASSTPPRPSSAVQQDTSIIDASGSLTPSLKRSATSKSTTTSKRQRSTDLLAQEDHYLNFARPPSTSHELGLSRIKSGRRDFYGEVSQGGRSPTAALRQSVRAFSHCHEASEIRKGPLMDHDSVVQSMEGPQPVMSARPPAGLSSDDFGSVDEDALLAASQAIESVGPSASQMQQDQIVEWTDPITKQSYRVNSRTGVVLPIRTHATSASGDSASADATRQTAAINTTLTSAGKPLSLVRRANMPGSRSNSSWLPGFLKDWNNPVFHKQDEESIPVASFDGPGFDLAELGKHRCTEHMMHERFAEAGARVTSKLSKSQLKYAKVIRQVDQKFVLCLVPSAHSGTAVKTLVLVDQHAASERVILEKLLRELCALPSTSAPAGTPITSKEYHSAVQTVTLERPQRFQISLSESELFPKHAAHFARWGILYDLSQHTIPVTASQVRQPDPEHRIIVRTLPPGIAERCTLAPNLLIELLRSEIWGLASGTIHAAVVRDQSNADNEHSWLRHIGTCPKGIIDMLNSRACRSAIMFNDVLDKQQCEDLLAELGRCAFPFMCAHGRVSMVPVMEMGNSGPAEDAGLGGFMGGQGLLRQADGSREKRGFVDAYRHWRDRGENII